MAKRKFKNAIEHRSHVRRLLGVSCMPDKQKGRWEQIVGYMNANELDRLQSVLENEISELADIYLQVLDRKNDARAFNVKSDVATETLSVDTNKTFEDTQMDIRDIFLRDYPDSDIGDSIEYDEQVFYLQKLIKTARCIDNDERQVLLEHTTKKIPIYALKQIQAIIISQGLRNLQRKQTSSAS